MSETSLINASAGKAFLLDVAKKERPFNKFNRVSKQTMIEANEMLRRWYISRVKGWPSKGKTL